MNLSAYLNRIGFTGTPQPDLATLRRIHRLHLAAIPYENLDVQLGRRLDFDLARIFAKLVSSRRGGWCYEMNGLMAWALEQIGFRVTRLAGGVRREVVGDVTNGSHLVLCVHLDRPYLADVGFGDGIVEPTPIAEGGFEQDGFEFRLERVDESWWRFRNQPLGGAPSFDFRLSEAVPAVLAARCEWLQTSLESGFVQNAVCQRYVDGELRILRGRVLRLIRRGEIEQHVIDAPADFEHVLQTYFGIELDASLSFWDRISLRHEAWLKEQAAKPTHSAAKL